MHPGRFALAALALAMCTAQAAPDARKGEYLTKVAGCVACHTDQKPGAVPFAGGRALHTPFGTFYGPNITPHRTAGLGRWSESDFRRALRLGERPDGSHYFPVFPYLSYTAITDEDVGDMWAFLRSVRPSDRASQPHALRFPYGWRDLLIVWKWLFFRPGPFVPEARASAAVNRGAYLAGALGHCGECHTPRNFLGAPVTSRRLAGGEIADGRTPNLTPARLKRWNDTQLREFFRTGATPEGDVPAEAMDEVIRNATSQLTAQDLDALVAYLRALPPVPEARKR